MESGRAGVCGTGPGCGVGPAGMASRAAGRDGTGTRAVSRGCGGGRFGAGLAVRPGDAAGGARSACPAEPLARRIERLAASGDPRDAYRAWWLLHACVVFERTGRLPEREGTDADILAGQIGDPARACVNLNERMKMTRIDHLERAARAFVPGALEELVEEGPFGDPTALTTRPDDPLVKAWKERVNGMLNGQAEEGYWSSLYQLFTGFWFGHPAIAADRQSALAYGMALRDIMVKLDGVPEQQADPVQWTLPRRDRRRPDAGPESPCPGARRCDRRPRRGPARTDRFHAALRPAGLFGTKYLGGFIGTVIDLDNEQGK